MVDDKSRIKHLSVIVVAGAMLFLPSILSVTGQSMFGTKGTVAGAKGLQITGSN